MSMGSCENRRKTRRRRFLHQAASAATFPAFTERRMGADPARQGGGKRRAMDSCSRFDTGAVSISKAAGRLSKELRGPTCTIPPGEAWFRAGLSQCARDRWWLSCDSRRLVS
jgi:hypothetical protein